MRTVHFHDEKFDEETLLKLKLFRAYIRAWIPVFLHPHLCTHVNIFDLFAGPGRDAIGNPGSPAIILEELETWCQHIEVAPEKRLNLYFNDKDKSKTDQLEELVKPFRENSGWNIEVRNLDFAEAYSECLPHIQGKRSANLLIIDQFGYKHMPPERFAQLASCKYTDLICFMSSSYIRRFVKEEAVQRYINISPEEFDDISPNNAHRIVCKFYRHSVPASAQYYVAPFSIQKNANYYGLMFGSGNLRGLEKFLTSCWDLDMHTGEANFPIDKDPIVTSGGQLSFVEEDNVPKKQREFETNLTEYLSEKPRSNREIYRFTLENGFLPKHAVALLKDYEKENRLIVHRSGSSVRKGYYLSYEHYSKLEPKAIFHCKSKN